MKKLFVFFAAAAVCVVAGCSKENPEVNDDPKTPTNEKIQIAEADKNINFTDGAGEYSVTFTAKEAWTAALVNTRADGWCTISPTSGSAGQATIRITAEPNDTTDERSASVQIKSGSETATIVVTQKQQDALTVTQTRFDVPAAGGSITVEIAANVNVEYAVDSSAAAWVHASQGSRAVTASQLTFTVDPNRTDQKREGSILIYGNELSERVMIYQEEGEIPSVVVSADEVGLSSAGQSFTVEVSYNVDVTVEISADGREWLTHSETRAMSTNTYVFNVTENDTPAERSATIGFVNAETGTRETVTVKQQGVPVSIIVSDPKVTLSADEQSFRITVSNNCDATCYIPADMTWISRIDTRAMRDDVYTFKVSENTDTYPRSGAIIFFDSRSGEQETLEVVQNSRTIDVDTENVPDDEIWYMTRSSVPLDFDSNCFDRKIVSNTFKNGFGVLKFDGAVKTIKTNAFTLSSIMAIYLPETIEAIHESAIYFTGISTFRLPSSLKTLSSGFASSNKKLESFSGPFTTEDGKCVIMDKKLYAYAPAGSKEFRVPEGVEMLLGNSICDSDDLESFYLPEGVKVMQGSAVSRCPNLRNVSLPASLEEFDSYVFLDCPKIERFDGDCKYISEDRNAIIKYSSIFDGLFMYAYANGCGLSEYTIPEGVKGVEYNTFRQNEDIRSITLPNSLTLAPNGATIAQCPNMEAFYGPFTSSDHRCIIMDGILSRFVGKGVKEYRVPDEVKTIGWAAFTGCELETLTMSDNVEDVESFGYIFEGCPNLKTITISAAMKNLGTDVFNSKPNKAPNLTTVYLRAPIPPSLGDLYGADGYTDLTIYVPEQTVGLYMAARPWEAYRKYIKPYKYDDLNIDDFMSGYVSTDYSQDGTVEVLQKATKGNGIDIVMMGDAFSDRQIADGTYHKAMQTMADNLFSEEPYKSFRELFNVYVVNVVSMREGYDGNGTALGTFFGEGTFVGGNDALCFEYAQNAISEERMDEVVIIVSINIDAYSGTCFMYYPTNNPGDYSSGPSVAYFPTNSDAATLLGLVLHEAGGHGFSKLADEYSYEDMGTVTTGNITQTKEQQDIYGWWKNVDFTGDPSAVRWNYFISDYRYANEGLGAYEGGLTYWNGVWRPTENSIMRYNYGGFNAPSREAIYYRIHKLAYGDSWQYDYEEFVKYDEINRKAAASAAVRAYAPAARLEPTHAPVVVKKTWRDAK